MSTTGTRFPDTERWFGFRPDSYSPDICPEHSLAGRVRGTWRRYGIQNAYDHDKVDSLSPRVFEETLPSEEIEAMEKGDKPNYVSGERLPLLEPDEVEIARVICWGLTKAPVIAVYARPRTDAAGYRIRLVSEFTPEITEYPITVPRPLTLGELIDMFDHAKFGSIKNPGVLHAYLNAQASLGKEQSCGLIWFVAMRCVSGGYPLERLPRAAQPCSAFYPNLQLVYRLAFTDWAERRQRVDLATRSRGSAHRPRS